MPEPDPIAAAEWRVLLVDDNPEMRLLVRLMIEDLPGWRIVGEAPDGAQAVALASTVEPDVIVLDFHMPVMDGLHAALKLRAALPQTRIVMWSSEPNAAQDALQAGVDVFIDKTRPIAELLLAMTPSAADVPAPVGERRRERPGVRREDSDRGLQLVLSLPEHRLAAGQVISYDDHQGSPRTVVLPGHVTLGRPVLLHVADATAGQHVELLLLPF